MPLNEDDPKVRTAAFGRQVELFLESDIGKYLLECARREEEAAVQALKDCDPTDSSAVVAFQMKARVSDLFLSWLGEAVHAGQQAIDVLNEEQIHG